MTQPRSKTFVARPTSTGEARRFVMEWLRERDLTEFGERAALAVSELTANAVLHTHQPFTVRVKTTSGVVRLEVVDSAPDRVPVRVPMTGSAVDLTSASETGRGLQILSALAHRWGVVLEPNVKTVWAEFEGSENPEQLSDPALEDKRPPRVRPDTVHHFRFVGLPVRSAIASGLDVEDLVRELQMQSLGDPSEDAAHVLELVDRSASVRLAGRHAALHAASQDLLVFDLDLDATDDALIATGQLSEILAKMPRPRGRRGPSAEVQAFRTWLTDETLRQRAGAEPTSFPFVPPLADEWLWEQATCGYAAMTPDGRIVRINPRLARWLGVDDSAVIGRALVDLLAEPSRHSFTEELLPVLDRAGRVGSVPLSFVCADGTALRTQLSAVVEYADDSPAAIRATIDVAEGPTDQEAALVKALQQTLIPPAPPVVAGLDVAAAYHPAQGEVGGDFYDVFEVADGDWCVVLGDVSGKGVEAAIVTAAARHAVRSSALREPVPSDLLRTLNGVLLEKASSRFCTVALLRLQEVHGAWVATLTSGGHPYPLLIRHGTATKLGKPGSLLGVFSEVEFHDVSIRLAAGDALVFYTDGVTEARDAEGEFFGEERMNAAVIRGSAHSAQAMVDAVMSSVLAFQAGASDDIALVVIRRPEL